MSVMVQWSGPAPRPASLAALPLARSLTSPPTKKRSFPPPAVSRDLAEWVHALHHGAERAARHSLLQKT